MNICPRCDSTFSQASFKKLCATCGIWADDYLITRKPLYLFSNGCDYIIAHDTEDAWSIWRDVVGECDPSFKASNEFKCLQDDELIFVWMDENGDVCEEREGKKVEKTAFDWIKLMGRGWLCSSEQ